MLYHKLCEVAQVTEIQRRLTPENEASHEFGRNGEGGAT